MTAPTNTRIPVDGSTFRQAVRINPGGMKRRRLLALVAAFADGGVNDPTLDELAARLGGAKPRNVFHLLQRLEADGHLEIHRQGKKRQHVRYAVVLPEDGAR